MTLPKDLNGKELVRLLQNLGYEVSRQTGSHIRLTTHQMGTHHVTIPNHKPLKIGTLSGKKIFGKRLRNETSFKERIPNLYLSDNAPEGHLRT